MGCRVGAGPACYFWTTSYMGLYELQKTRHRRKNLVFGRMRAAIDGNTGYYTS